METKMYDYNLPKDKIALYPPENRGESKLLVIDRGSEEISHHKYNDISNFVRENDAIVLNNTKVVNSRLYFQSKSGDTHEVLFLPKVENELYDALVGRSRKLKKGSILYLKDDIEIKVELVEKVDDQPIWHVKWINGDPDEIFARYGHVPLPPYIDREDTEDDKSRYNTTFAQYDGSSASPTASLNLTDETLQRIRDKEAHIAEVTLHVGWGTFAPIRTDKIEDHKIHTEWFQIEDKMAKLINASKIKGGRVWTFGTTATRVIESSTENGVVQAHRGDTGLYIYPGYKWKMVDVLLTNFHAPRTSLLTLVASFMGYNLMMKAYQEALENDYKFLSYGDSMLIL